MFKSTDGDPGNNFISSSLFKSQKRSASVSEVWDHKESSLKRIKAPLPEANYFFADIKFPSRTLTCIKERINSYKQNCLHSIKFNSLTMNVFSRWHSSVILCPAHFCRIRTFPLWLVVLKFPKINAGGFIRVIKSCELLAFNIKVRYLSYSALK